MKSLRIMSVVGARPNFMKIAPFVRALEKHNSKIADTEKLPIAHFLVHTGQHYDSNMSDTFFRDLDIPKPNVDLGIGSGTHAEQVGGTMIAFENVLREWQPDWVVVVGDVNATCACSITAKKEQVKLAHIEAGLRSFDMNMPEEINRLVTDRLSDLLFTPDIFADQNLLKEGAPEAAIKRVGNIMIDTLAANRERAEALETSNILSQYGLEGASEGKALPAPDRRFAVMTLHRPSNVDSKDILQGLVDFLVSELSQNLPIVWTLHPRTRERLKQFDLWDKVVGCPDIILLSPLGYREMLKLNIDAALMLTDSGGLQEECCVLGTPCITLRDNTERPITSTQHGGVSILAGNEAQNIRAALYRIKDVVDSPRKVGHRPPLWDGQTAGRIVDVFANLGGPQDAKAGVAV